jgi:hypothetical protein
MPFGSQDSSGWIQFYQLNAILNIIWLFGSLNLNVTYMYVCNPVELHDSNLVFQLATSWLVTFQRSPSRRIRAVGSGAARLADLDEFIYDCTIYLPNSNISRHEIESRVKQSITMHAAQVDVNRVWPLVWSGSSCNLLPVREIRIE